MMANMETQEVEEKPNRESENDNESNDGGKDDHTTESTPKHSLLDGDHVTSEIESEKSNRNLDEFSVHSLFEGESLQLSSSFYQEQLSELSEDISEKTSEIHRKQFAIAHANVRRTLTDESSSEIYRYFDAYGSKAKFKHGFIPAETFIYMTIPLDGGYAWVILLVAFIIMVVSTGIVYSVGLFLPSIAKDLTLTESQLGLIVSMHVGAYYFSGPFASAFVQKGGFRPVAVSGAAIASISFFIASFSNGIMMLVCSYGVAGSAFGFLFVSTQLILSFYFGKYRPLAMGIASSGSGAGVVVFSILNQFLLPVLGWRSIVRLHAAIILLLFLLTLLFSELKPTEIGRVSEDINEDSSELESSAEIASMQYSVIMGERRTKSTANTLLTNISKRIQIVSSKEFSAPKRSADQSNWFKNCFRWCFNICRRKKVVSKEASNIKSRHLVIQHAPLDREDIFYSGPPNVSTREADVTTIIDGKNIELHPKIVGKVYQVFEISLWISEFLTQSVNYTLSMLRTTSVEVKHNFRCCHPKVVEALHLLFDTQLFRSFEFNLLFLAAFCYTSASNIPYMYGVHRVTIDEPYRSMILPIIGATNMVFRVLAGVVLTKFKFNVSYVAGSGIILGGLFTMLSGFGGEGSIWFQFTFATTFGISQAFFGALRSIIYVDILGLEKLTSAVGLISVALGLGAFVGPAAAGFLRQATGDFRAAFVFSGFFLCICGLTKIILPSFKKKKISSP